MPHINIKNVRFVPKPNELLINYRRQLIFDIS